MTNIYIYCLFDRKGIFQGVYSSLKAAHRDALKSANTSLSQVYMHTSDGLHPPLLVTLRNLLKGQCEVQIGYGDQQRVIAKIIKTRLKE